LSVKAVEHGPRAHEGSKPRLCIFHQRLPTSEHTIWTKTSNEKSLGQRGPRWLRLSPPLLSWSWTLEISGENNPTSGFTGSQHVPAIFLPRMRSENGGAFFEHSLLLSARGYEVPQFVYPHQNCLGGAEPLARRCRGPRRSRTSRPKTFIPRHKRRGARGGKHAHGERQRQNGLGRGRPCNTRWRARYFSSPSFVFSGSELRPPPFGSRRGAISCLLRDERIGTRQQPSSPPTSTATTAAATARGSVSGLWGASYLPRGERTEMPEPPSEEAAVIMVSGGGSKRC